MAVIEECFQETMFRNQLARKKLSSSQCKLLFHKYVECDQWYNKSDIRYRFNFYAICVVPFNHDSDHLPREISLILHVWHENSLPPSLCTFCFCDGRLPLDFVLVQEWKKYRS